MDDPTTHSDLPRDPSTVLMRTRQLQPVSAWVVERLIRWRWGLLVIALIPAVLAVVSWIDDGLGCPLEQAFAGNSIRQSQIRDWKRVFRGELNFDRSIENMFAPDNPLLDPYEQLKRTFGGNEVVMAVYQDDDLLSPGGMQRLTRLEAQLQQIPGVEATLSLRSLTGDDIIDDSIPESLRLRELFQGYTHSADHKVCAVVCMLLPEAESTEPRARTIEAMRDTVAQLPQGTIAGEPVMVVDGFRYIESDGRRLGWSSTVLLVLTVILSFRSLRWTLIPIAVVQLTLLLTRTILVGCGLHLSMVSTMLTAIVTIVGVATVIDMMVRFREARDIGLTPIESLLRAATLLAMPIFWACSTDAVGFSSLLVAQVGPVQDFGLMMAIGSLLVMFSVACIMPSFALAGDYDKDPRRVWGEQRLEDALDRLLHWTEHRPKTVAIATIGATLLAGIGSYRLTVESDFTRNFRRSSPIVQSYAFVETRLGGAGVWDVLIPAPEVMEWNYLRRVLRLENRLRREVPGLTKVLSLADAIEARSAVDLNSMRSRFQGTVVRTAIRRLKERMPVFTTALVGPDPASPSGQHYLRIMLRAYERQPSSAKQAMIADVERISREEFPAVGDAPPARVTGLFVLMTNLISSMLSDQWAAFLVATAGIGLMMLMAFRSFPLAAVALIPNALPIVILMGLMGWLGIKINMGAAMIAAVSMGLSIDSAVHYISAYLRARRDGQTQRQALDEVQKTVGRARCFSTLALVIGFSSLCISEFIPTVYFGVLVTLTMIGGLLGNVLVLPLLLKLVTRP